MKDERGTTIPQQVDTGLLLPHDHTPVHNRYQTPRRTKHAVRYTTSHQPTVSSKQIKTHSLTAADSGRVTKGAWIEGVLRRLSVALCKGNEFVFRANLHSFCRTTGKHPTRGVATPHTLAV